MVIRMSLYLIAIFLSFTGLLPAFAQQEGPKLISYPSEKFLISPGGVDMRTGRYVYEHTDLDIGSDDSGLRLVRSMPMYISGHANPFGNFSHNWDIMIVERRVDLSRGLNVGEDYRMTVHFGGRTLMFEGTANGPGYGYKSGGPLATLTVSGAKSSPSAVHTMTAPDGTILIFRPIGGTDCIQSVYNSVSRRCAFISRMIKPNGTVLDFTYDYNSSLSANRATLRSVRSTVGYAILFEYSARRVAKACIVNLAVSYVAVGASCSASWTKVAYTYSGGKLSSVTLPDGAVANFTYTPTEMNFINPGDNQPWLTNQISLHYDEMEVAQEITNKQVFADGRSYSYSWSTAPYSINKPRPAIVGGTVTDNEGQKITVRYEFPVLHRLACPRLHCPPPNPDDFLYDTYQQTPEPVEVRDQLGRVTINDFCDPVAMEDLPPTELNRCVVIPLQSSIDPEGIKTLFEYDNHQNIIKITRVAKPNSGLPNIVTSAAYGISNPKTATKPLWTIDARGNRTDYTYDPSHGGMLTTTGPAVNGIRAQTRYSYTQRYTWIKNGSAGYVRAAAPIWMLTQKSTCQTTAASGTGCTGGQADEVKTLYDYGPDSGPNNLLLRGIAVVVDGQTLRTCYTYDANGRQTSETPPRADLSACP